MPIDISKYSTDPNYETIKDASGQVVQIRQKPKEYISRIEKESGEQAKATYSPHIIKFIGGKPTTEEFYDINPSVITSRTRLQVPYTPVVVNYDPSGNVVRRQEFKWDWGDKRRGSVVPKLDEKFENGQLAYRYDAKAGSYVKVTDVQAGTITTTPVTTPGRSEHYTFGQYGTNKLVPQAPPEKKGVGWYDPQRHAFIGADGKVFGSTSPGWVPTGYVGLDAPLTIRPGESYYDKKLGGVVTGNGQFFQSSTAFAPQGTTLIGTSELVRRSKIEAPSSQEFKLTGKETAADILFMAKTSKAPEGYRTPAGERVVPLTRGYEGTTSSVASIARGVFTAQQQQEALRPQREKYAADVKQMIEEKFYGLKAYGMEPEIITATLTGQAVAGGMPAVTIGAPVQGPQDRPSIPTVARRQTDYPTIGERVAKGWSGLLATPLVSGAISGYERANKETSKYTNILLFGTTAPPETLKELLVQAGRKQASKLPQRDIGVNLMPYEYVNGKFVSQKITKSAEKLQYTPGSLEGYNIPGPMKSFIDFGAGFQQQQYKLVTTRPLDIPTVYALSYAGGAAYSSAGAALLGGIETLGATRPFWSFAPKYVAPAVSALFKGGMLYLGGKTISGQYSEAKTAEKKGELTGTLAYYGIPGIMGFAAGTKTRILPRLTYEELPETIDVKETMRGGVPVQEPVVQYGYKGIGYQFGSRGGPIYGAALQPPPSVEQQVGTMLTPEGASAGPMFKTVGAYASPVSLPTKYNALWGVQSVDISRATVPIPAETPATFSLLQRSQLVQYPDQASRVEAAERLVQAMKVIGERRFALSDQLVKDVGKRPVPQKAVEIAYKTISGERAEAYGSSTGPSQFETPYYRSAGGERVPGDIDTMLRKAGFVTENIEKVQSYVSPESPSISQVRAVKVADQVVSNLKAGGFDARLSPSNKLIVEIKGIEEPGKYGKFMDVHHPGQDYPGVVGEQAFGIPLWQQPQTIKISGSGGETAYIMPQGEAAVRKIASILSFSPQAGGYAPEANRLKDINDALAIALDIQSKGSTREIAAATKAIDAIRVLYPDAVASSSVSPTVVSSIASPSIAAQTLAFSLTPIAAASSASNVSTVVRQGDFVMPAVSSPSLASKGQSGASVIASRMLGSPSVGKRGSASVSKVPSLSSLLSGSISPSPSRSVSPSVSLSTSLSRSLSSSLSRVSPSASASLSASISPSASTSLSKSLSRSMSTSKSVSASSSASSSASASGYRNFIPPPWGVPRLDLGEVFGGGVRSRRGRKFKYTPDIQAVILGQFTSKSPKKGLFTGQERRLIISKEGISSKKVGGLPKSFMDKF